MRAPEMILPAKINLRALAAVSKFAGTDENRFYLMGVRVEIGPRGIVFVATDGKRLIAYSDAVGVIMPVKVDEQRTKPLPAWAEPYRQAAE